VVAQVGCWGRNVWEGEVDNISDSAAVTGAGEWASGWVGCGCCSVCHDEMLRLFRVMEISLGTWRQQYFNGN